MSKPPDKLIEGCGTIPMQAISVEGNSKLYNYFNFGFETLVKNDQPQPAQIRFQHSPPGSAA